MRRQHRGRPAGFSLIEALVAVGVLGILLALVGPSFKDYLLVQRLKSINAQLVTDMNFARSEAVTRNNFARVVFQDDPAKPQTCYTIFVNPPGLGPGYRCNCDLGPGAACPSPPSGPSGIEIRTVQVPRSSGITITAPGNSSPGTNPWPAVGFSNLHGGLLSIPTDLSASAAPPFNIEVAASPALLLRTVLGRNGRPTVCSVGNNLGAQAC
ncbi:GspH/FimT family pseudopilin [Rubrivivax sp. RP6-9]|uniref:GspH/FimT family pseudopilin n=1 Tax=Rubrivivax sp. RP6-9 TaxID=3415750 RepID=UPI003CC682C5